MGVWCAVDRGALRSELDPCPWMWPRLSSIWTAEQRHTICTDYFDSFRCESSGFILSHMALISGPEESYLYMHRRPPSASLLPRRSRWLLSSLDDGHRVLEIWQHHRTCVRMMVMVRLIERTGVVG